MDKSDLEAQAVSPLPITQADVSRFNVATAAAKLAVTRSQHPSLRGWPGWMGEQAHAVQQCHAQSSWAYLSQGAQRLVPQGSHSN